MYNDKGTYGYDDYFGKLAANGGNYARLWLTDSAWDDLAVEVEVGNMSLSNTWLVVLLFLFYHVLHSHFRRLDYVVQLAEKLNIHLLMCTESFNYFCTVSSGAIQIVVIVIVICLFYLVAPCDWYLSYYNVANGGFLSKPQGWLLYIKDLVCGFSFQISSLTREPKLITGTGCVI